ncbi:MAG: LptF/LptG family permease [Chloroflexi bacterium]|nr:LptF/LptG family permease [Chloroflexota bacterium]
MTLGPGYCAALMRLLDRYLLRELLIPLAYCLSGFLIFWMAFDLFSQLSDFQQKNLRAGDIAQYYLVKTPELLVIVLPIALLLGVLYALTNHARHNELTAIRVAGISLWRSSLPYLSVGLLFSLFLFALNEWWLPNSVEKAERILSRRLPGGSGDGAGQWEYNLHFRNAREGRIWSIGAYHLKTYEMKNPHVEWNLPDGSSRHLIAKQAVRTNGCWTFLDVQQITYPPGSEFDIVRIQTNAVSAPEFSETPEEIKIQVKFNHLNSIDAAKRPKLSLQESLYLRAHLQLNRQDRALVETQLHARLAEPWTCLVVVLIALPFGAASSGRNIFVGVASSLLICFGFFILLRFGLALGTGGYIPAWLAAWFPNIFFAGMGFYLARRLP